MGFKICLKLSIFFSQKLECIARIFYTFGFADYERVSEVQGILSTITL